MSSQGTKNETINFVAKRSKKKTFRIYSKADVVRSAWMLRTFDEDRYIKISLSGLFVKIGNFSDFKTIDELYEDIRSVVDSKGLIIAKRKNQEKKLAYCKFLDKSIPLSQ